MPKISIPLLNEYLTVYGLNTMKNYTEPKMYDANGDLNKRWYVYFSYRNPDTGKMKRQAPIHVSNSKSTTKAERYELLNAYRKALVKFLEDGLSPYDDNELTHILPTETIIPTPVEPIVVETEVIENISTTIKEGIALGLTIKKKVLKETSFPGFKSDILRFEKSL